MGDGRTSALCYAPLHAENRLPAAVRLSDEFDRGTFSRDPRNSILPAQIFARGNRESAPNYS